MRILAIDPGVMTGYCYATIEDGKLTYYPFQTVDDVDDLWRRLNKFGPKYIVIEDFKFRQGRQRSKINLFPVQLIGIARLWSLTAAQGSHCYVQGADVGKQYYTDILLKKLGLHIRGKPHAMDASRHLLQWCMFGAGNQFIGSQSTEDFATLAERQEWWDNGD